MEALEKLKQDTTFTAELSDCHLSFTTTWGLFSPRGIDDGTRLLIDHLDVNEGDDCLDLGCGYGPLGIVMGRLSQGGKVVMADKDFVAVEYARRNASANRVANVECVLSNGCGQLPPGRFDVIASNLPSNTGKELLQILLQEAHERLNVNGRLYLVTVNGLRDVIKRYLREGFGNYKKLKQGQTHAAAMARRER